MKKMLVVAGALAVITGVACNRDRFLVYLWHDGCKEVSHNGKDTGSRNTEF